MSISYKGDISLGLTIDKSGRAESDEAQLDPAESEQHVFTQKLYNRKGLVNSRNSVFIFHIFS